MMDGRTLALLVVSVSLGTGSRAKGDDAAAAPVFYETTTVSARPVESASSGVTVVSAASIEASEARTGADAVAEGPGVALLSTGGRAGTTNALIRGGDSNFTLVLLDGVPLNDSTESQGGAVNLEEMGIGVVDRAEIVRGTASSFYGATSLAGAIQFLSPRGGPGPLRARVGAEVGDASLRRGFGRVSGPAFGQGWAAGASWSEEAGRVGQDRFEQLDLWGTGDLKLGGQTESALTLRYARGEQDDYPDSSGGPLYGSGQLRSSRHQDLFTSVRLATGPVARRHRLNLGLVHRSLDRLSPAVAPVIPASTTETGFTRARISWQVPLLARGRHLVEVGVSAEGEWGRNESLLFLPPEMGGALSGDFDLSRQNAGAFAGWRHERGRVSLEASLRGDLTTDAAAQLNPRAGIVWRARQGTRLHASLGRASKTPSFYALGSPRALGGNPDLRPERAVGAELGVEQAFVDGNLTIGAGAFSQRYRDLVDFDFETLGLVNRSRVRSSGVEARVSWRAHAVLLVDGEVTWVRTEDRDGATLLQDPDLFGGLRVTWTPRQGVSLRAFARASSGYEDRQIPAPERSTVDGRLVAGLAGSWRLSGGCSLRARVDNLLDAEYETLIGFPGPTRSAWVGLGWER